MTQALLEPSFADAVAAIEAAVDLPPRTRAHWACSLRQIANMDGKPMDSLAARLTSARFAIDRLHHARVGANPKTLANHKSNAKVSMVRRRAGRAEPRDAAYRGVGAAAGSIARSTSALGLVRPDALLLRPGNRPDGRG
jgi:hypothetical protein